MRITFLSNHDLASTFALNLLLEIFQTHDTSLFFTHKAANKPAKALLALSTFERCVLQKLSTSKSKLKSIDQLANKYCRFSGQLNSANDGADFELLKQSNPSLIVSIRHMTILQDHVIGLARQGVINLHSGLLPQYQGVMASFWAMLNREAKLGSTLHHILNAEIDSGDIINMSEVACNYSHSYLWNVLNLYPTGTKMIVDAVARLEEFGSINAMPQTGRPQYHSFPTDSDISDFNKAGNQLFWENELSDFGFNWISAQKQGIDKLA